MLSPFPGMDPFLELPAYFPGLHGRFVAYVSEALQRTLPSPYFAEMSDRLWFETAEPRHIEPDVDILHPPREKEAGRNGGGVAMAPSPVATLTRTQPAVIPVFDDERHQTYVNIGSRTGDGERVVATIEVLSLTNKTPGERGRDLYLKKQQEVVDGRIHLIEIDLLRGGTHATLAPRARILRAAGSFDYHVCLHRVDDFVNAYVYTIQLEEKLPTIDIPLLPGDGLVALDLQAVFERCYEAGPYRRRVRYEPQRLDPLLTPERTAWVHQLLADKGLLPTS